MRVRIAKPFSQATGLCPSFANCDLPMLERLPIIRRMHTSEWSDYRKRRLQFFVAYLVVCPSLALLAVGANQLAASEIIVALVIATGGIAFLVTALRLSAFVCPRCGKPFFHRGIAGNPLTRNCLHCNLPKWAGCNPKEREFWLQEAAWKCLNCGIAVDPSADRCMECGWTYAHRDGEHCSADNLH